MNNQVKTYPIKFTIEAHKAATEAAYQARMSLQQFILAAIQEKVERCEEVWK